MRRKMVLLMMLLLLFVLGGVLSQGTALSGEPKAGAGAVGGEKQLLLQVPEGKAAKWKDVQNRLYKEEQVCREHCGYNNECLKKCEQNYKARLDREYDHLMAE
jgi:hypothetical protein